MKKVIDILLVIVLLVAVGYLVFNELNHPISLGTPTATVVNVPTEVSTPTLPPTATLSPPSVMVPSITPTASAQPTATFTRTPTETVTPTLTPSLTPTLTPTNDPTEAPSAQEMSTGIERGNKIIKAIEDFHNAQGTYPSTLDALVPDYFPSIPVTTTDEIYYYRLFDPSGPMASEVYWLSFRLDYKPHTICTYLRRLDYWDCNPDSP